MYLRTKVQMSTINSNDKYEARTKRPNVCKHLKVLNILNTTTYNQKKEAR